MSKAIEIAQDICRILTDLDDSLENTRKSISNCDKEEQDILHDIELSTFNLYEGYLMAKAIKEIRGRRREAKNEFETLDLLRIQMCQHKTLKKEMLSLQKTIVKKQLSHQTRTYKPRIRTDLKLCRQKAVKEQVAEE